MIEMIIDAHMHYFNVEGFDELARLADHENSRRGWQDICETNHIAFSVAMGNSYDAPCRFGGVTPRLINLGGEPFCVQPYNQPDNVGYCLGVQSEEITPGNAERTAMEFEYYQRGILPGGAKRRDNPGQRRKDRYGV